MIRAKITLSLLLCLGNILGDELAVEDLEKKNFFFRARVQFQMFQVSAPPAFSGAPSAPTSYSPGAVVSEGPKSGRGYIWENMWNVFQSGDSPACQWGEWSKCTRRQSGPSRICKGSGRICSFLAGRRETCSQTRSCVNSSGVTRDFESRQCSCDAVGTTFGSLFNRFLRG